MSSLCLYRWGKVIWFKDISTVDVYLMSNPVYTGCFNINGTYSKANNSTNNNVLFCFRFENSILLQLLILDHKALDKRGNMFLVTAYLETKSFKTVSK